MRRSLPAAEAPLYEQLAGEMARHIAQGLFRPGERLPSVRRLSQQKRLSITTVVEAYRLLEDRGAIEARPQSGYFVKTCLSTSTSKPEISTPPLDPTQVSISDLAMMVMRDTHRPELAQFGAGIPDPTLLPTDRLNRILSSIARRERSLQHLCCLPEGWEPLRVQIARRVLAAGCELRPEELVITTGCTEAISLALRAVTSPGDLVAVESPTYFGLLQILESLHLQVLEIPTHCCTGISLEALRFAIEHHPVKACLLVPNFNNPLGSLMPREKKQELVEMLNDAGIPLIEDDIHGELYFGRERPTLARAFDRSGRVIACSSFSKDISPSYRVGWLAAGHYTPVVRRLKLAASSGTALLPQMAIAEFMTSGGYEHHLRRIRRAYAEKVAQMAEAVLRTFPPGTRVTLPEGCFLLWVQMPPAIDSLVLYKLALRAGITLMPGHLFSATPHYRNYIRLNAAYWSPTAEPSLRRLAELVKKLNQPQDRFGKTVDG